MSGWTDSHKKHKEGECEYSFDPSKSDRILERLAMTWTNINQLCDLVRETAFAIHCYHRNGHLEKVYENALAHRLRKQGLAVLQQHPLPVFDEDGTLLGDYYADLFVEGSLIVELKAVRTIVDEHLAQMLGYLKSSRIETGLLINFGAAKLSIKKYLMTESFEPSLPF